MRIIKLSLLLWLAAGAVAWAQATDPAPQGTDAPADVETGQEEAPQATGTVPGQGESGKATPPGPGGKTSMLYIYILLGGVLLMWLFMGRGRKKQQRQREQMLASLSKGDKVTTIGGIVGTVVDIKDDEVTLKVDESANVRMKFLRRAIHQTGESAKAEGREQR